MKKYGCNLCDYKTYYIQHIKVHQKGKLHQNQSSKIVHILCQMCEDNVEHTDHSYIVVQVQTPPNPIIMKKNTNTSSNVACLECSEICNSNRDRINHYKDKHPGINIYKSNNCKYSSNYLPNLNVHVSAKHEKTVMNCTMCTYTSTSKVGFLFHMRKCIITFKETQS